MIQSKVGNVHRTGKAMHDTLPWGQKKGSSMCWNPLIYLVAGAGFEPTTFGL